MVESRNFYENIHSQPDCVIRSLESVTSLVLGRRVVFGKDIRRARVQQHWQLTQWQQNGTDLAKIRKIDEVIVKRVVESVWRSDIGREMSERIQRPEYLLVRDQVGHLKLKSELMSGSQVILAGFGHMAHVEWNGWEYASLSDSGGAYFGDDFLEKSSRFGASYNVVLMRS